ncbi:MAG: hypothetical protein RL885_24550, partial [Planctomycetota bacterium]
MNSSQRPFDNETQQGPFGRGSTDPHALSNACRQLSTKLGRSLLAEALKGPALLDLLREAIEEIARGHAPRAAHHGLAQAPTGLGSAARATESVLPSFHRPIDSSTQHHDVSGAPALWAAGLWAPSEPLPPSLETTPGRDAAQEQQTETEEDSSRDSDSDADAEREIEETIEASKPSHLEQLTAAHDTSMLFEPALRSTLEAFEGEVDDEPIAEPTSPFTEVSGPLELTPAEAKAMLFDVHVEAVHAEDQVSEATEVTSTEYKAPQSIHAAEHETTPVAAQDSEEPGAEPIGRDWLFDDSLLDSDLSFLGTTEDSFGLIDPDASFSRSEE